MLQKCFFVFLALFLLFTASTFADVQYDNYYSIILDYRYHHLGDVISENFLIPKPEGTYWETHFLKDNLLNSVEIAFVKFLAKHIDFADLIVNDNRIRILEAASPTAHNYLIYIVPIPINFLKNGRNVIGIKVNQWDTGNFDDIEFGEFEIVFQLKDHHVLSVNFDSGDDGFVYGDDTFYDTNRPQYASGDYTAVGGTSGSGGLHLALGNVDSKAVLDGMSGGWTGNFYLDNATDVEVSLDYRLIMRQFDTDECAQVLAKIDDGPVEVLEELCGRGKDTGWQTTTFMQSLSAGDHTITIGGYNNKKTGPREAADIYFDNVEIK